MGGRHGNTQARRREKSEQAHRHPRRCRDDVAETRLGQPPFRSSSAQQSRSQRAARLRRNQCLHRRSELADWTVTSFVARKRDEGKPTTDADVRAHIHARVRQQGMCEAIANTAKHSRLKDRMWPDGEVRIDWNDASEDDPAGFILRHVHPGGIQSIALNAFGGCCQSNANSSPPDGALALSMAARLAIVRRSARAAERRSL